MSQVNGGFTKRKSNTPNTLNTTKAITTSFTIRNTSRNKPPRLVLALLNLEF